MKLYTFIVNGRQRIGAERDGKLIDLAADWQAARGSANPAFADMLSLLRGGSDSMNAAKQTLASTTDESSHRLDSTQLLAPITHPGKVLCSGINYHGHFAENPNAKMPGEPFFFNKLPSAFTGPGQPIIAPKATQQLDYEVEFCAVIGKRLPMGTPASGVMESIAGYTILNDVSARDVQFKDNQITLGKNFDTFAPMGPCLVTADELPDLSDIKLRAFVNGRKLQDGSTSDWVFSLPTLIGSLLRVMTLEIGDIVSTGTPAGVGYFQKPQVFMKPGDTVMLEVEGIGRLENPIVAQN